MFSFHDLKKKKNLDWCWGGVVPKNPDCNFVYNLKQNQQWNQ
jgi:hypothetical protein